MKSSWMIVSAVALGVTGCNMAEEPAEPTARDEAAFASTGVASQCTSGYVLVDGYCMDQGTYDFFNRSEEPLPQPISDPGIIEPGGGGGTLLMFPVEDKAELDKLKADVQQCFDGVDYNRLGYSYAPAGETYTHRSGSTFWSVGSYLASSMGWLVQTSDQARAWTEAVTFGSSEANQYIDSIVTQMNQKFTSGGFQNYQKVCLAQCVASRMIKYQENFLSKFGGASTAVAQGVGVCTEFSAIAQRLISSTSSSTINSWVGYSPGHAFVQVQFDGNTYSVEPQSDPAKAGTCRFYN